MIIDVGGTQFEKANEGIYLGTIIDVVELGEVKSRDPRFGSKTRTRIVWVLNATDKQGKPLRVMESPVSKVTPPGKYRASRLYEIAQAVLGTVPDPFDDEILIGRSNQLVLQRAGEWVNIKAILPLPAGAVRPVVPAGFIRAAVRAEMDAEMQALNQRIVQKIVAQRQAEQAQQAGQAQAAEAQQEPEEILL